MYPYQDQHIRTGLSTHQLPVRPTLLLQDLYLYTFLILLYFTCQGQVYLNEYLFNSMFLQVQTVLMETSWKSSSLFLITAVQRPGQCSL